MMQFTINQSKLMQALNVIKAPCRSRFALEILNHALIQARAGAVSLTTTDLSLRITATVKEGANVIEEGEYTANYRQQADMVKGLPRNADITIRQQENALEVVCSGRKFVTGIDAEVYPNWVPVPAPGETYSANVREREPNGPEYVTNTYSYEVVGASTQQLCVSRDLLASLLSQVAYAAEAEEDLGPMYQSIFADLKGDLLTLVAAKRFCLAEHTTRIPGAGSWKHGVLLNAKSFVQIVKRFPKNSTLRIEVTLTREKCMKKNGKAVRNAKPFFNARQVRFTGENLLVSVHATAGTYPNYRTKFPAEWKTRAVCATADLLSGYQAVWPVAKDANNVTKLRIAGNIAFIEAQKENQPEPTVHEVPAKVAGPDAQILLNCQQVVDFLRATKAAKVAIEMTEHPGQMVLFRSNDGGEGKTRYGVMPLTLNK
jgi:DNA polymerase III sliding clamp (beta) subunit (PCNA family)